MQISTISLTWLDNKGNKNSKLMRMTLYKNSTTNHPGLIKKAIESLIDCNSMGIIKEDPKNLAKI